jgi:hypothetical protein
MNTGTSTDEETLLRRGMRNKERISPVISAQVVSRSFTKIIFLRSRARHSVRRNSSPSSLHSRIFRFFRLQKPQISPLVMFVHNSALSYRRWQNRHYKCLKILVVPALVLAKIKSDDTCLMVTQSDGRITMSRHSLQTLQL